MGGPMFEPIFVPQVLRAIKVMFLNIGLGHGVYSLYVVSHPFW